MSKFHNDVRNALKSLTNLGYGSDEAFDTLTKHCKWKFLEFFESPLEVQAEIKQVVVDHAQAMKNRYYLSQDIDAFFNISRLVDMGMVEEKNVGNIMSGGYVSNNKIDAIKIVRHLTGWYLKDCKNFVEGLPRKLYHSEYILLREMFGNALCKQNDATLNDILDEAMKNKGLDPIY